MVINNKYRIKNIVTKQDGLKIISLEGSAIHNSKFLLVDIDIHFQQDFFVCALKSIHSTAVNFFANPFLQYFVSKTACLEHLERITIQYFNYIYEYKLSL